MIVLPNGTVGACSTVVELIRLRAASHAGRLAFEIGGKSWTYDDLDRLSDTVAANLGRLGVASGDRVATMMFNSIEQILTFLATVKLGAVWAPLNVALQAQDLRHVVEDSDPKVLIFDGETEEKLEQLPQSSIAGRSIFVAGARQGRASFEALLDEGAPKAATPALEAGDPAIIIYTGGTTGLPKGVVLPHFAVVAAGHRYIECFGVSDRDVHYSVLSLFHVGGLLLGFVGPLVAGIPTHFERWFSASRFWERTRETGATIIDPIGTMVSVLCKAPAGDADRDNPVRVAIGVLSQVPDWVPEAFRSRFDIEIANAYSLTETGGTVIIHNPADSPRPKANGKAWGWADISIRDAKDLALPPHEIGEICLRPNLPHIFMQGYFNKPEATVETWRNLWLHTGDRGYLDEDGYLFFVGRQAHWLRVKGENVSAYEVESLISEFPGVEEVVIVGVPAELGDEEVKAFLRVAAPDGFDARALVEWCASRMAKFKIPRYVEIVDEFPRSATKREVERHKLAALGNGNAWDSRSIPARN